MAFGTVQRNAQMTDADMRSFALNKAIEVQLTGVEVKQGVDLTATIIARAEKFYDFVKGDGNSKAQVNDSEA